MKEIKKERTITDRNDDSLGLYLQELVNYPLLTADEEAVLVKKIRAGDTAALDWLVSCNLRFVITVAKKYRIPGTSLADLVAEGSIGLFTAAERFDETRGFKFISYAVWWIRQAILQSIEKYKRMIRLPTNQLKGITDIWKADVELEQRLNRLATTKELAEFMKLPYQCILEYKSNAGYTSSYDVAISDDHQESRVGTMTDTESISLDEDYKKAALHIDINLMMNVLNEREREILRLAYGIGGGRPLENREIGDHLGLSSETVRREKGKIFIKLKTQRNLKLMQEYI